MSEPKCQACGLDYCVHTLEKQLAERDAALARCVDVLNSVSYLGHPISIEASRILDSLPASAQATAKVLAAARRLGETLDCYTISELEAAETALIDAIREEREGK